MVGNCSDRFHFSEIVSFIRFFRKTDPGGFSAMAAEQEYQVVARRYRPQRFDELIGQEHIAQALTNAILNNRIGHAYLFTGARGVGKTSSARIFAKSLNCVEGPTATPCNRCEICQGITQGEDLDVIEIDGASNRGIDQIRTLIQNVNVRPVRSRFKIFIIDEVHMLTNEAFNALLKTLEEPPEHVKFIFCTTEVNKIPITILSRCQRFDFAGIGTIDIANRLQKIVTDEGLTAEPDAIRLLARRANGSMRDGQSLLEQLLAFTSGNITLQNVHQLLGTANDEVLIEILRNITRNEPAGILRTLDLMIQQGADPGQFLEQLFGCLRDLMALLAGCGSESFLFLPIDIEEEAREMAQKMGLDLILAAMQIVDHTLTRMKISTQGRLLAEMAFVRICSLQSLVSLSDVISRTGTDKAFSTQPAVAPPQESTRSLGSAAPVRASAIPAPENWTKRPARQNSFQPASSFPETRNRESVTQGFNAPNFPNVPDVHSVAPASNGQKTPLSPPPDLRHSFVDELEENPDSLSRAFDKKKENERELTVPNPASGAANETANEAPPQTPNATEANPTANAPSEIAARRASPSNPPDSNFPDSASQASSSHASSLPDLPSSAQSNSRTGEKPSGNTNPDSLLTVQNAPPSTLPQEKTPSMPSESTQVGASPETLGFVRTEPTPTSQARQTNQTFRTSPMNQTNGTNADDARLLEIFLEQLNHFQNNPTVTCLTEIKNLSWSSDGRQLTVVCPQRCEFGLQQFQKDPHLGKELEKLLAKAFGRPYVTLKFIVEQTEESSPSETSAPGLRQLYQNPLVQAAEALFDATILRVENME